MSKKSEYRPAPWKTSARLSGNRKDTSASDWSYYKKQHPFCEVCDLPANQVHHIVCRGNRGEDAWDSRPKNLISLCAEHHREAHAMGRLAFPEKYGLQERWQKARQEEV